MASAATWRYSPGRGRDERVQQVRALVAQPHCFNFILGAHAKYSRAQWVKPSTIKSDDLSSIPGSYTGEREN